MLSKGKKDKKMGQNIETPQSLFWLSSDDLNEGLNQLFERVVEIPRMRHGSKQSLDTLISEEALIREVFEE